MRKKQQGPLPCSICGGVYFQEAEFRQYHQGTYSASPGGEPYPVIEHGPRVRICLCGQPEPIVTQAVEQKHRDSFAASLQKALTYRMTLDPNRLQAAILQIYASKQDASELNRMLARLLEIVGGPDYQAAPSSVRSDSKQKIPAAGSRKKP